MITRRLFKHQCSAAAIEFRQHVVEKYHRRVATTLFHQARLSHP
jgi:hypothetical protein